MKKKKTFTCLVKPFANAHSYGAYFATGNGLARLRSASALSRKAAFTLAEVLITLTILGVVGAITVPSLIQMNTKRTQITKLAKAYSTLETAAQNIAANSNCIGRDLECTVLFNTPDENTFMKKIAELAGFRILKYSSQYPAILSLNYEKNPDASKLIGSNFASTYANMVYLFNKYDIRIYDKSKANGIGSKKGILVTVITDEKKFFNSDGSLTNYTKGKTNVVMGRNAFVFVIYDNFKVEPVIYDGGGGTGYWPLSQLGKSTYTKVAQINGRCNPNSTSSFQGESCAARIIRDGWKMKY